MCYNNFDYSTTVGPYFITYYVKVPFCRPDFSNSKIISRRFCVDNDECELVIGYYIIIGRYMMVQLGLTDDIKCQFLSWDDILVFMKYSRIFLGQYYLNRRNMSEVVIHNV